MRNGRLVKLYPQEGYIKDKIDNAIKYKTKLDIIIGSTTSYEARKYEEEQRVNFNEFIDPNLNIETVRPEVV
jgi:hypothetical protein